MGLKSFLKQQGFIEDGADDKKKETGADQAAAPVYFPVEGPVSGKNSPAAATAGQTEPSFVVAGMQQNTTAEGDKTDPTFIRFFEDELVKANLPGPDYFEFRQQLVKTQQKMAAKGVMAPEVVLQAVLTSFEAQDTPPSKLAEAARHYKEVLRQKNDDFLKGAAAEKNNQLQKRQSVLQAHNDAIQKIQQQVQQLELQKRQLEEAMNKEKTQLEVDKTLGKEGIEKIERAEKLISQAHDFMQSAIDADIKRLQSV